MPDLAPIAECLAARDALVAAALAAGARAARWFRQGERTTARIEWKGPDRSSPVTEADHDVDAYLRARLTAFAPDAAWLSEETADDRARLAATRLLIVDPIDGTRAFMTGDPRWAVCAALSVEGRPVAGCVHLPALGQTYAAARGAGATLNGAPIAVSARPELAGARIDGPRPAIEALARGGLKLEAAPRIPSLAFRLVSVASGALDLAIAGRNAHDWDLAAADAILHEAGGALTGVDGLRLVYNRAQTRHAELLAAPRALHAELAGAARRAFTSSRA